MQLVFFEGCLCRFGCNYTSVCKRMPCLSYPHMKAAICYGCDPDFQTNDSFSMQMRTLGMTKLYRDHYCLFKYQGSTISSFDLGILINRMDIETAIHAGATIPLLLGKSWIASKHTLSLLQASRQPEEAPMVETNLSSWKTDGARLDAGECCIGFRYSAMKGILVLWKHQRVCHTNPFEVFLNTSATCNGGNQPCVFDVYGGYSLQSQTHHPFIALNPWPHDLKLKLAFGISCWHYLQLVLFGTWMVRQSSGSHESRENPENLGLKFEEK